MSEIPVQAGSPACYTIEDDDEPEVVYISDNSANDNLSEEDSRDGEPSSTTSDINGDGKQGNDFVNDEFAENGTNQEASESDASDEDESSGNVLNDFIKLIDLVNSYEKVDRTVKTKFKDGFLFLENLQTQFEDTERNINEKNDMIEELIAENNKLKEDNKQLMGEMSTQSLQFGMLKNKYMKLEEELKSLKISEKMVKGPPAPLIPIPTNLSLETMKSKADKLQHFFRELCSKMSEERVAKSDPESVKSSKELKSFQNEVGVLFIKVQHKLSKWAKNQVKMEEELERCRLSLERLHDMAISGTQMKTVTSSPTVAVAESSTGSKKRKLPPPQLLPLQFPITNNSRFHSDRPVTTLQQPNTITQMPVPNELTKTLSHSPTSDSVANSDENLATQSIYMKIMSSCDKSPQVSTLSSPLTVAMQPSPQTAVTIQPSPTPEVPKPSAPPQALSIKSFPPPSPLPPVLPIQSSPKLKLTSSSLSLPETTSSPPSQQPSSSLHQLLPLPPLNVPISPTKPINSPPTSTSSSDKVTSRVSSLSPKAQAAQVYIPLIRRRPRAKPLKTPPPQLPQTTSAESRYHFTPPQYSKALRPVHPQYNPYPVSHLTPNKPHQATLQACQNQIMQVPFSTAPYFLPQQQHQITSTAPPVSTQNNISPSSPIPETPKQTPQNKCQVCGMSFSTSIQLKLHHTVVHSNKTPSSALTGPAATSPSSSSSHQQSLLRPLLVPPPPLQERHRNAASLSRVSSIGQAAVSTTTTTSIGTTTTTWSTNQPNQKRHCSGLSPLSSVVPSSSIPKSQVAPFPINSMNNSVNFTQPFENANLFSFLDQLL